MAKVDLSGIFPPITTPFDSEGNVDIQKLTENLEKWEKIDLRGYVVLGSNGEFPYLTETESLDLVTFVKRHVAKNKLVIAGVGRESTSQTVEMCQKCASIGVDAVLVITPNFYKSRMTHDAFYAHYTTVANKSPVPVILYNVPSNTGVDLPIETVTSLATHRNIIGLKESSPDVAKLYRMVAETKHQSFQVMVGSAGILLPALQAGCVGSVCAAANCIGSDIVKLYKLFLNGTKESQSQARELQARIIAPNAMVTRQYGVAALKHIMDLLGYYGGPVRSPLQTCSRSEAEETENTFRDHP